MGAPIATFEALETDVKEFVKEIDLAISLSKLSKVFHQDKRISQNFDNTYEAHPFVLCRHSIDYSLTLSICRCHDKRSDSHGLSGFFAQIKNEVTKKNLRAGILARRRLHVDEQEAITDTNQHLEQIQEARDRHISLKSSHRYASVRDFRHTYIAHRGRDKTTVKSTETTYLYELVGESVEIVNLLTAAILGSHEDFQGGDEIWEMYVHRFFNKIMTDSLE